MKPDIFLILLSLRGLLPQRFMHPRLHAVLLIFILHGPACSGDTSSEDVAVDEQLGDPFDRLWCEGEYSPPKWNDERATKPMAICLGPQSSGECKLCPREEVVDDVETKMREILAEDWLNCDLQHWEFGCMRTVEISKMFGYETDYCCYQVALWGPGCKDDTTVDRE